MMPFQRGTPVSSFPNIGCRNQNKGVSFLRNYGKTPIQALISTIPDSMKLADCYQMLPWLQIPIN
jgi:hypothetical protein